MKVGIYISHSDETKFSIKHGSFGGPGLESDDLFASGSDDFRGYVWKIPPLSVLKEQRKEFSEYEWDGYQPSITEVGELYSIFFLPLSGIFIYLFFSQRLLRVTGT